MASSKPDRAITSFPPQLSAAQTRSSSSTATNSPIEQPSSGVRSPFGSNGLSSMGTAIGSGQRMGTGSPSHEIAGSRLFSKRAREIQAQEGLTPSVWGPPTSGNSTPLRENIPESPTDGFPGFSVTSPERSSSSQASGRARAGTVPSQFSPGRALNGAGPSQSSMPKINRSTPSGTPFKSHSPISTGALADSSGSANHSALLSRLRSGSMPQQSDTLGVSNPFGPSLFSTNWSNGRERSTTLTSILSGDSPLSPTQSSFSKDGVGDHELRTLDYLGLADTPQAASATLASNAQDIQAALQRSSNAQQFLPDFSGLNKNTRYRSYSVNAKEQYAEDEEDELENSLRHPSYPGGILSPAASIAAAAAATNAEIHRHNLAVQAFVKQATASRPRAITVGAIESPQPANTRHYLPPRSHLENSINAADLPSDLLESIIAMQQPGAQGLMTGDNFPSEGSIDGPTRALWLGSIPPSTTVSSLNAIFGNFGKIESARVLTHKNCGFVNFDQVESATQAKSSLNGKEIFPGAGPIRIGFAKAPDTSSAGTPNNNGAVPSPSPDPFSKAKSDVEVMNGNKRPGSAARLNSSNGVGSADEPSIATVQEMRPQILDIVKDFGATEADQRTISAMIDVSSSFSNFESEIPPVPEATHSRVHDAPRLREIRKRIDNNSYSQAEIEEIATSMLPEIAELSSDYLGNTVVQKLFEFCQENVKEMMLQEIAPRLAEIGIHKNGTWAAQKIIDVARTPTQMNMIIEHLRPYTDSLFLDQYGNYVLQCCLRFGSPWNNFIFETMLSRMWDIAQGRFGSRAMRACLESHHSTKEQQRMLAAAIALNSVELATNANGALLLTWLLDTCTFPQRRTVLAPRLAPHIVQLCTHKVAYLTVLKIINQRNEPEARDSILKVLFLSPKEDSLAKILSDHTCGATLIFKVLTTPFFDESLRGEVVQNIRDVLVRIKAQPSQGYKRLMDEVGMSTRSGANGSANRDRSRDVASNSSPARRPGSQSRHVSSHTPQQSTERPLGPPFFQNASPQEQTPNMQRNSSLDPASIPQYDQYGLNTISSPMFTPNPSAPISPMSPQQLQWQQQQILLAQAQANVQANARTMQPDPFYSPFTPNLGGYPTTLSVDPFRTAQIPQMGAGMPAQIGPNLGLMGNQSFAPNQVYSPMLGNQMMQGGFGYAGGNNMGGLGFFPQSQQQMPMNQNHSGGRRGRQR